MLGNTLDPRRDGVATVTDADVDPAGIVSVEGIVIPAGRSFVVRMIFVPPLGAGT